MEKLIPVVVIKELSETDKILTALKNNGINCAEITFRTTCAKEAIAYACKHYPEMSVGAGTVINAEQCQAALDAGAQFIVSPGLSVAVAEICKEKNINVCGTALNGGKSPSAIYDLIKGRTKCSKVSTIKAFCQGAGLTLAEFFDKDYFNDFED